MRKIILLSSVFILSFFNLSLSFWDSIAGDIVKQGGKAAVQAAEKAVFEKKESDEKYSPLIRDEKAAAYVDGLLKKLRMAQGGRDIYVSIYLNDTPWVQGWIDFIADEIHITRGMLNMIDNEAMLAGPISHELGHIALNHADRRLENSPISAYLSKGIDLL